MHIKRQIVTTKLPIKRKGTTYVARTLSNLNNSVPVMVALREMLGLAKTGKEVEKIIQQKLVSINGRTVEGYKESIQLFNIFKADKTYILIILPTGKFSLQPTTSTERLCKVIGKKLLKNNQIQLNLHDGTNILSKGKISIGDSVYVDSSSKIKKHVSFEKGKEGWIISGRYIGLKCKIQSKEGKNTNVLVHDKDAATKLNEPQIFVI